jgi:hypothetical protein
LKSVRAAICGSLSADGARACAELEAQMQKELAAPIQSATDKPKRIKPHNILAMLLGSGVKLQHGERD